jgi:hypothetical protein
MSSLFKIKINCTHKEELTYKNKEINKNTKFDFNNIDNIESCYLLKRKLVTSNITLKSLEFIINKSLNLNELRNFINILQNLNFKSKNNTYVQFIDITDTNNYKYIYSIDYNMSSLFKIKINCTHKEELTYKNKKITKYNIYDLKFNDIIINSNIIYTLKSNITLKSLEIIIKQFLNIDDLHNFLKNLDFKSQKNILIELIDITNNYNNNAIYKTYFNNYKKEKDFSTYTHLPFYTNKSI